MAVAAGVLFALAWVLAPRHGLLVLAIHRIRLRVRIVSEDILGFLFRFEERGESMSVHNIRQTLTSLADAGPLASRLAIVSLKRRRLVYREGSVWKLSDAGRARAVEVVRSHRLWETWLWRQADLAADHVHGQAMRLEHVTDERMRAELEIQTGSVSQDPHGRPIPAGDSEGEDGAAASPPGE